jgi:shikimate 5-dehydrogenase
MLVAQGVKQFEIWTEKSAPVAEMRRAALLKLE